MITKIIEWIFGLEKVEEPKMEIKIYSTYYPARDEKIKRK